MMSKGDSRYSSGSWARNLYQKFEAVCQEVDDIVTHEHMKKLENHVQLVGDNVMKFCSNVKDLIPSSFGAPAKHVVESANRVFELKDGDGECPSVSDDLHSEDNLQNTSFRDPRSLPSGLKLVKSDPFLLHQDCEDSHFEEEKQSSEIPEAIFTGGYFIDQGSKKQSPFDASELICHESSLITEISDSFEESESNIPELAFTNEDLCEEEKQSSEISEVIFTDGYFIDQSSEKPSPFDASVLTCHESSLITENSHSFTKKEEESLSNIPELASPDENPFSDEDPCEEEKQSSEISEVIFTGGYFIDQTSEKQSPFDALEMTCHESSLITEHCNSFTNAEEESLTNVREFAFPDGYPCERSTSSTFHNQKHEPGGKASIDVSPSAFEHISESEFRQKETVHDNRINDSFHENNPGSEFQLKEETVLDSLSKSFFDVTIENVPYSLLASSVTSSDSETSTVRLASSINSPLLDFSDHHEIEFHRTEGPTYNDMAVEIGSTSTSALAFQSSDLVSHISSPKENTGDFDSSLSPCSSSLEFTEIPIISDGDNGGVELKQRELPGKLELDGSCIFVKNDRNYSVSPAADKCWLSKKKFRGPFSSRKKLEKEYKQLAIWYCDIDAEFNEGYNEKVVSSSHNKHQSDHQDLQESEWELL